MSALARLWAQRDARPRFVAAASALLAVLCLYPAVDLALRSLDLLGPFRGYDYGAYRMAVDAWLAGEPIYWRDDAGGYHGSYLYPPVYLLAFAPFVALDGGLLAWQVAAVGSTWLGLQAVAAAFRVGLARWERALLLWLVVGFQPMLLTLELGQVTGVLAGLLCGALAALEYGRRADSDRARLASGALTAVGGTVKLVYLPVGAHLLADRRRFVGALAAGVGLAALSLSVFGVEYHLAYLDVLRWGKGWGGASKPPTRWQQPYFQPLYLAGAYSLAVRVVATAAVAALAVLARGADADVETFALGVVAVPLLAPRVYVQDFLVVVPGALALLAVELGRDGHPAVPLVALLSLQLHSHVLGGLVGLLQVWPPARALEPALSLFQLGLWGSLLLVGFAAYRVAERTRLVGPRSPGGTGRR